MEEEAVVRASITAKNGAQEEVTEEERGRERGGGPKCKVWDVVAGVGASVHVWRATQESRGYSLGCIRLALTCAITQYTQ